MQAMTAKRPKLAIDASPELVRQLKIKAAIEGVTVRAFVLNSLMKANPDLAPVIREELLPGSNLEAVDPK